MRKTILRIPISFLISIFFTASIFAQGGLNYPKAKKVNQVDDYHGTKVADPFRWLEDPDSADSRAWIKAQNKLTSAYLNTISQRAMIKKRLTELWNYEKYSSPFKRGNRYFYYKNDGLQNQSVLYVANSITDKGRVLLDPNNFSEDGTTSLAGLSISEDGNIAAYGLSKSGSDWREWRFVDIRTGKHLPDVLKNIKFSIADIRHQMKKQNWKMLILIKSSITTASAPSSMKINSSTSGRITKNLESAGL